MTHLERLRIRPDFLAAAKGEKKPMPGLVLQARVNSDHNHIRYGLTASKKVGNAVARNRVRRRLRVAAEQILPHSGRRGFDYVLIGRQATLARTFRDLLKDLESAIKRIHDTPQGTQNAPQGTQNEPQGNVSSNSD
ncbi:MAG: ribonuclease P protein component [Candidatus Micropelagos sp.]|jgi:ribonuclease P protein component|nr:ribonuclease P protein component [Candidatus Micropelagos sp.]NCG10561.1 ribonuclease P protein component [Alphaproteobacteria bacterium]